MGQNKKQNHPDIETLASYITGLLNERDTETLRAHVEDCPICRLEIERIKRFERIDSDAELLNEAGWQTAQVKLERAFQEKVLPEVAAQNTYEEKPRFEKRDVKPFWVRWRLGWLAPVAVAAAVLLFIVVTERPFAPERPPGDLGPMRGPIPESFGITLEVPSGPITEPPEYFSWQSGRENDYYTIEIFTSDLSKIYEMDGITELRYTTSDSLKSLLKLDTIYLWSVTGHKGLERESVSPNEWFRITDSPVKTE